MVITYIYLDAPSEQVRIQLRCRNMADAINRTGVHQANMLDMASFIQNTPSAQKVCNGSDLLIIYRYLYGPILTAIQYWKARDKKIVIDFDQPINHLTTIDPGYDFWYDGIPFKGADLENQGRIEPSPMEQFRWGVGMVDAMTVPLSQLGNEWLRLARIFEIPNYINTYQYPGLRQNTNHETWVGLGIDIGQASLEKCGVLHAMEKICRMHPQVKLILYGTELINHLPNIDPRQMELHSLNSFEEWVDVLLGLNIGLVPMNDHRDFQMGYSDALEFMVAKIPFISGGETNTHRTKLFGLTANNTSAGWEEAILNALDQIESLQQKSVNEPFLFAIGMDIGANTEKILKIYKTIQEQR